MACAYQLKGLEQQVTETQQREVQYGGLPPGKYEFWVQCHEPGMALAIESGDVPVRGVAELLADVVGAGGRGVSAAGMLLGIRVIADARAEPPAGGTGKGGGGTQRGVAAEEQRAGRYFADGSADRDAQPAVFLRDDFDRHCAGVALAPENAQIRRNPAQAGQELIFLLVDIDRFKRVNDDLGHAAGDRLLQEVAKRIEAVMRRSDDLVRWGGEEFLLVCRTTDRENASLLCNRVLEAIREVPFDVGNGVEIHKTCSIGWAPFPWLKEDVELAVDRQRDRTGGQGAVPGEARRAEPELRDAAGGECVQVREKRIDREFAGLPAGSSADCVSRELVSCDLGRVVEFNLVVLSG